MLMSFFHPGIKTMLCSRGYIILGTDYVPKKFLDAKTV